MKFCRLLLALLGVYPHLSLAAADYTLIADIVGRYRVLEYNGEPRVGGNLEIVADEKGVGIVTSPISMASHPLPPDRFVTAKELTVLIRLDGKLTQNYVSNASSLQVEYRIFNGLMGITLERCLRTDSEAEVEEACKTENFLVSRGAASGDLLDPKIWFESKKGELKINLAGGHKPKESQSTGVLLTDFDPAEASIFAGYCPPNSNVCSDGYLSFPWEETKVFRRKLSDTHELTSLIVGKYPKISYLQWEEVAGKITLRNFQFIIDDAIVCMEHEMVRAAEDELFE